MPVKKVGPGKWRYGSSGKIYPTKAQAEKQARAIHANQNKKKKK